MTDLISREAAIATLTMRRGLLDSQLDVLDISRELAIYGICIDAIRALSAQAQVAPMMICNGCGSTLTDAEMAADRAINPILGPCCPIREMRPATRADWDNMRAEWAADLVARGKSRREVVARAEKAEAERDTVAAAMVETLAAACLQDAQRRRKRATDLREHTPANEDNIMQYNRWIAGAIGLEVMAGKAHELTPAAARAALDRMIAEAVAVAAKQLAQAPAVAVKPLVWKQSSTVGYWTARSDVGGTYVVADLGQGDGASWFNRGKDGRFPTESLEAAQAAAQADYEARILAAIEPAAQGG